MLNRLLWLSLWLLVATPAAWCGDFSKTQRLVVGPESNIRPKARMTIAPAKPSFVNMPAPPAPPNEPIGPHPLNATVRYETSSKCKTCTDGEMAGHDPSKMIPKGKQPVAAKAASPAKAAPRAARAVTQPKPAPKVAKKQTSTRRVARSHRRSGAVATARRKPAMKAESPLMAPVAQVKPVKPQAVSLTYERFLDCKTILKRAQALIEEEKMEEADKFLKDLLEQDPDNTCVRGGIAKIAMCRAQQFVSCREYECAARRLREALFVDPNNKQATQMLDEVYRYAGIDPKNVGTRLAIASYLEKNKRLVGGFVEYYQSLLVQPTSEGYFGLGRSAVKLGQPTMALVQFEKGLAIDPSSGPSWRELGFLRKQTGNVTGSAEAFTHALALNPSDLMSSESLFHIWQSALAKNPNDLTAHLGMARTYSLIGQSDKAQQQFEIAARMAPDNESMNNIVQLTEQNKVLLEQVRAVKQKMTSLQSNKVNAFLNEGPTPNSGVNSLSEGLLSSKPCPCNQ